METTKVKFYMATYEPYEADEQPTKEVLAVFVDEKYYSEDNIGYGGVTKEDVENTLVAYAHLGQHSSVSNSFLAENCKEIIDQEMYKDLLNELTNLVGYNLIVV